MKRKGFFQKKKFFASTDILILIEGPQIPQFLMKEPAVNLLLEVRNPAEID